VSHTDAHTITLDALSRSSPVRASMLLITRSIGTTPLRDTVIVQDAATGQFLRPAAIQPGEKLRTLSLSADGEAVLIWDGRTRPDRVGVHRLSTGRTVWLDEPDGGFVHEAATIDGSRVAVLASVRDWTRADDHDAYLLRITVVDAESGSRETIFSADAGTSNESNVSWSPDGAHVALTYVLVENDDDGRWYTVVMHRSGDIVTEIDGAVVSPPGNAAWLDDTNLMCAIEPSLYAVDIRSGERRVLAPPWWGASARVGRRYIQVSHRSGKGPLLETMALGGSDRRTLVTITDYCSVVRIYTASRHT
jgi:hypothetical protein